MVSSSGSHHGWKVGHGRKSGEGEQPLSQFLFHTYPRFQPGAQGAVGGCETHCLPLWLLVRLCREGVERGLRMGTWRDARKDLMRQPAQGQPEKWGRWGGGQGWTELSEGKE